MPRRVRLCNQTHLVGLLRRVVARQRGGKSNAVSSSRGLPNGPLGNPGPAGGRETCDRIASLWLDPKEPVWEPAAEHLA